MMCAGGASDNPWDTSDFGEPEHVVSREQRIQQLKENSMNNQLEGTQRALASFIRV